MMKTCYWSQRLLLTSPSQIILCTINLSLTTSKNSHEVTLINKIPSFMIFQSLIIKASLYQDSSSIFNRTSVLGDSLPFRKVFHWSKPSIFSFEMKPPAIVISVGSQSVICIRSLQIRPELFINGLYTKPTPLTPPKSQQKKVTSKYVV